MNLVLADLLNEYGLALDSSGEEIFAAISRCKEDQDNDEIKYIFICECISHIRKMDELESTIISEIEAGDASHVHKQYGSYILEAKDQALKTCISSGRNKIKALKSGFAKLVADDVMILSASLAKKGLFQGYDCVITYKSAELAHRSNLAQMMASRLIDRVGSRELALKYFALSSKDDAELLYKVSRCELLSDKERKEYEIKALELAKEGSALGDIKSMGVYALMLMYSDVEAARRFAARAGEAGDARGKYVLAMIMKKELALTVDEIQALLKDALDMGYTDAAYELAEISQLLSNRASLRNDAILSQDAPSGKCVSELSWASLDNGGLADICAQAFIYYKQAADSGHKMACLKVGEAFLNGTGTAADNDKAFYYLNEAADANISRAQLLLGQMYYQGICGGKDLKKAYEYYDKAAAEGLSEAMYRKGLCLRDGSGTDRDVEKGMRMIKNAAKAGCEEAIRKIAQLYFDENEDSEVRFNAFTYLRQLADSGVSSAQIMVGRAYMQGDCIQHDLRKAVIYLKRAADKDESTAALLKEAEDELARKSSDINADNLGILHNMLSKVLTPAVREVVKAMTRDVPSWEFRYILQKDNQLFIESGEKYSMDAILGYEKLEFYLKEFFLKPLENEPDELKGSCNIDIESLELASLCKLIRYRLFEGEHRDDFLIPADADCNDFLKFFSAVVFLRNELSHSDNNTRLKYADPHNMRQLLESQITRCSNAADNAKSCFVKGNELYVILKHLQEDLQNFHNTYFKQESEGQ